MAKIVISTNTSLDGVVQDPDGSEGFGRGGWFAGFAAMGSSDRDAWVEVETGEAMRTQALLLGRHSYEWFATRWAARGGAWADRLNNLPKFVVSSSLPAEAATWGPTTVLAGDVVTAVTTIQREIDGDVVVYASYQLGQTLMARDLVDELRLFVHPWVLGDGKRVFGATTDRKPLRLTSCTTVGDGLPFLTYQVVRSA